VIVTLFNLEKAIPSHRSAINASFPEIMFSSIQTYPAFWKEYNSLWGQCASTIRQPRLNECEMVQGIRKIQQPIWLILSVGRRVGGGIQSE
jgi:hypothetical protein